MNTVLQKAIDNETIYEDDIAEVLWEICDEVHYSCNSNCPVFAKNRGPLHPEKQFKENRECDCFKNGYKMLEFLRS